MIKILCIGDPHFKTSNSFETDEIYTQVEKILTQESWDACVVLGDILDTFERINLDVFKRAISFLEMIHSHTFLILLIGNHDRVNNSEYLTDRHAFKALEKWDRTVIAWKVECITLQSLKILAVPYVPVGRFQEAINTKPEDFIPDLVFAHQEFKGAKMGKIISEHGDQWSLDSPLCISGHIHDYDILQENLIYPGTPFQQGFSDTTSKALLAVEFDQKLTTRRIRMNLTRKIQLKMTMAQLDEFLPEANKMYNISVIGNNSDFKKITNINLENGNVKLKFKPIDEDRVDEPEHTNYMSCLLGLIEQENPRLKDLLLKLI